jgi:hypothetical protein
MIGCILVLLYGNSVAASKNAETQQNISLSQKLNHSGNDFVPQLCNYSRMRRRR